MFNTFNVRNKAFFGWEKPFIVSTVYKFLLHFPNDGAALCEIDEALFWFQLQAASRLSAAFPLGRHFNSIQVLGGPWCCE